MSEPFGTLHNYPSSLLPGTCGTAPATSSTALWPEIWAEELVCASPAWLREEGLCQCGDRTPKHPSMGQEINLCYSKSLRFGDCFLSQHNLIHMVIFRSDIETFCVKIFPVSVQIPQINFLFSEVFEAIEFNKGDFKEVISLSPSKITQKSSCKEHISSYSSISNEKENVYQNNTSFRFYKAKLSNPYVIKLTTFWLFTLKKKDWTILVHLERVNVSGPGPLTSWESPDRALLRLHGVLPD